jgi:hypothetical protein
MVTQNGNISWNIIGNDAYGKTFGIAGTGGVNTSFGTQTATITEGFEKYLDSSNTMHAKIRTIETFLNSYSNNYLVLSNI